MQPNDPAENDRKILINEQSAADVRTDDVPRARDNQPSHSDWIVLTTLFAFSVVVRLIALPFFGSGDEPDYDELEHYQPAVNLVQGSGFSMLPPGSTDGRMVPTAFRMPGPSVAIAIVMSILGTDHAVARGTTICFSSLAAPLMFGFTCLFSDRRSALLAAVGCAVFPSWVYFSVLICSEPFFVPALLLALIVSVHAVEHPAGDRSLLAGFAWGLVALIKPLGFPMAVLTAAYLWYRNTQQRTGWRRLTPSVLVGVAFVVTLSPWVIRNAVTFGEFIPLATEGGDTFLGANNQFTASDPALSGMWIAPLQVAEWRQRILAQPTETGREQVEYDIAMDFLRQKPQAIPGLVLKKLWKFLSPVTGTGGAVRVAVLASYGSLLLLLVLGIPRDVYRSSAALHFAGMFVAVLLGVVAVYHGCLVRARIPLEMVLLPWAASATRQRRGRGRK